MHALAIVLMLLSLSPMTVEAQNVEVLPSPADSVRERGRAAGRAAAERIGTSNLFTRAFLGGVSFGIASALLKGDEGEMVAPVLLSLSGSAFVLPSLADAAKSREVPLLGDTIGSELVHNQEYLRAAQGAFEHRANLRKRRTAALGAFGGAVVGIVATNLVLTELLKT